jgi:hypothetical protein
MGLVLVVIGAFAYGSYVADGGFYSDDWSIASDYRFADSPRYWTAVGNLEDVLGGRPLAALLLPLPHALFGVDPQLHLGLALGLGIATSLCLYLMLRTLSLPPPHAGAIAVLALLFPWSDVIRLWPTASILSLSLCFLFLGVALAVNGFRRRGRAAIAMHACACALYLLSVLTYEATAGAALLAGFLYLGRAPVATAARRWLADIVVVLAAVGYSLSTTVSERHVGSIAERISDVGPFVRQSATLLVSSIVPVDSPGKPIQALVLLAAAGIVALALARYRRTSQPALRDWLRMIAIAVVTIGAAYFMFLGSNLHPGDPGIDMRANILAGIGFCILAYAIVAIGSRLLFASGSAGSILALVAALAIAVGYGIQTRDDANSWRRAAALQREVLAALDRQLPLPRDSTVLTFGFPAQSGPEVPIFDKSWDLDGAVKLEADDPTLRGFPVYEEVAVRCEPRVLLIDGGGNYGTIRVEYGRAYFLDVTPSRVRRIRTPGTCREALRSFRPGPLRA